MKTRTKNIKKSNWKSDLDYPNKPSANGFPDNPPPETPNGYHPEYGKRDNMYKTLDNVSSISMPGGKGYNPDINSREVVKINKKKFEEKFSNWRKELLGEGMTTKDFGYISSFGVYTISSVLKSADTENAQTVLQGSKELTDYRFGSEFPGSYVNNLSINSELGGELPNSFSKADIQMVYGVPGGEVFDGSEEIPTGLNDGSYINVVTDPSNSDIITFNYNQPPELSDGTDRYSFITDTQSYDFYLKSGPNKVGNVTINSDDQIRFKITNSSTSEVLYNIIVDPFNSTNTVFDIVIPSDGVYTISITPNGDLSLFSLTFTYGGESLSPMFPSTSASDFTRPPRSIESRIFDAYGPVKQYDDTRAGLPSNSTSWAAENSYRVSIGLPPLPKPPEQIQLEKDEEDYYKLLLKQYYQYQSDLSKALSRKGIKFERSSAGKLGKTTDAFNLGAPVSAFLANSKSNSNLKSKTLGISDFKSTADYDAFKAGGGNAALKQGKTLAQVIAQGKTNLGPIGSLSAADYAAFKAGGGNAALKQGKTLDQIVAQGKSNLGTQQGGLGVLGGAATAVGGMLRGGMKINPSWNTQQATNAVGNVKDYTLMIQDQKVGLGKGYSFSEWTPSKEGLKANLLKDGKPVIGPDGKPLYMTASGVSKDGAFTSHGKGQQTTGNNYRKIVNLVKSMTPATETGRVSVTKSTTTTKTVKGTPTRSASRSQPAPTERSTIKSMPASMMGKPSTGRGGGGGSASGMIRPVDPFDYPTDPLSGYTWDKKSGRYIANSYTPYINKIRSIIQESHARNKNKTFKQFVNETKLFSYVQF